MVTDNSIEDDKSLRFECLKLALDYAANVFGKANSQYKTEWGVVSTAKYFYHYIETGNVPTPPPEKKS